MPITVKDILEQSLREIEKPSYFTCKDRVLTMFDRARESLVPVKGRTVEQHTELSEACQAAQIAIVQTIEPENSNVGEEYSYEELSKLGQIPIERHKDLLLRTIARLEQ